MAVRGGLSRGAMVLIGAAVLLAVSVGAIVLQPDATRDVAGVDSAPAPAGPLDDAAGSVALPRAEAEPDTVDPSPPWPAANADVAVAPKTATGAQGGATGSVAEPAPGGEQAVDTGRETPDETGQGGDATPRFDIVRIDPDGSAVIAGRAQAASDVTVLLDEVEIGTARAGPEGGFVVLSTIPRATTPRLLSLRSVAVGAPPVVSRDTVIVTPAIPDAPTVADGAAGGAQPGGPPAQSAVAAGSAPPDPAIRDGAVDPSETASAAAAAPPDAQSVTSAPGAGRSPDRTAAAAPAVSPGSGDPPGFATDTVREQARTGTTGDRLTPDGGPVAATATDRDASAADPATAALTPEATDTAPRVLVANEDGIRVVQDPDTAPALTENVVIDSIGYDPAGEVVLNGRGAGGEDAFVRLYLDNRAVATAPLSVDGAWRADLPDVDPRVYTLRVDEVNGAGDVMSRAETPFKRASVAELAALPRGADDAPVAAVTVQPGFTLWRIARERYGDGVLYVRVFEANAALIRDPDLIYPGQIFAIPD